MNAGKAAVLIIGGACIGAGVTTLVLKKKYEARAEEEIASVRETYIKQISDLEWILEGYREGNKDEEDVSESEPDVPVELPKERVAPSKETVRTAYHKMSANAEEVEGLKETVEELGYSRKEEPVSNSNTNTVDPYVIPVQAYMDDEEGYDQMTLTYYSLDKVLVDDAEQVIHDVEGTVGYNNLHNFGVESGNNDTVYIRNEKRAAEYEILRVEDRYSAAVLGVDTWDDSPEPKEPIRKFR